MAFGGARADNDTNSSGPIPSLLVQLGLFLGSGGIFQPDTLVSVWAGANDIFQDVAKGGIGTDVGNNTANDVVTALGALVANSAKNLLVFNLPDFGVLPRYASNPLQDEAIDAVTAFNATLSTSLDLLEFTNPDLTIYRVDTFNIFNALMEDSSTFGISNATAPCIATVACISGPRSVQDGFLFWDEVHPTRSGHRLIEAAARQALAPVPLPATAPLLLAAFALIGLAARRRATA